MPRPDARDPESSPELDDLLEALRDVVDPELGVNVVDLGLVYGVSLDADRVCTVDMTLTSAACPLTDVIEDQTEAALDGLVSGYKINWVWLPPWGPEKITEDGREQLRALGFNVSGDMTSEDRRRRDPQPRRIEVAPDRFAGWVESSGTGMAALRLLSAGTRP